MRIILKKDVPNLGLKGEIKDVRPGYAHNFLIPTGAASFATPSNMKVHQENMRQMKHKADAIQKNAEALAEKLSAQTLVLEVEADGEKIFGNITPLQISSSLRAHGASVAPKQIEVLEKEIKQLGLYQIQVALHPHVKPVLDLHVKKKTL